MLDRSGVDVVTVANNHGADYGAQGLRDTVRAGATGPVAVVGVGRDVAEAFTPYRETIRGVDVAVLAADASFRESVDPIWGARAGTGPGMAAARVPDTRLLIAAVEKAAALDDLVVVYLHWGDEGASCPTGDQRTLANELSAAGADVVVGAHTHTPVGAGMLGDTYVSYGLGNFLWYNGARSDTGVLRLTVRDGVVVSDAWRPATIVAEPSTPRGPAPTPSCRRTTRASSRSAPSCAPG